MEREQKIKMESHGGFFKDEMNYRFCFVGESRDSRMRK
jgi:hypothetical protein